MLIWINKVSQLTDDHGIRGLMCELVADQSLNRLQAYELALCSKGEYENAGLEVPFGLQLAIEQLDGYPIGWTGETIGEVFISRPMASSKS